VTLLRGFTLSNIDELESSGWGDRPAGEEKNRVLMGSFPNWTDRDLNYLMRRGYINRVVTLPPKDLRKFRIKNRKYAGIRLRTPRSRRRTPKRV